MDGITEIEGDLFDAPEGVALIHACNSVGAWGKGIAKMLKEKYPGAYRVYHAHCHEKRDLKRKITEMPSGRSGNTGLERALKGPEGTALLIPPQPEDYTTAEPARKKQRLNSDGNDPAKSVRSPKTAGKKNWIICLFTSWHYSKKLRSPLHTILSNTALALQDLQRQLEDLQEERADDKNEESARESKQERPTELWSCRFNAGLFGVPWKETKTLLEETALKVKVVRTPGEPL